MKISKGQYQKIGASILGLSLITLSGCTNMSSGELTAQEVEISGQLDGVGAAAAQGAQKLAGNLAAQAAASDYSINCMTLTSPARNYSAAILADGQFHLKIPAGVSIGCFVVSVADQAPVASLYIEAEQKTMGTSLSSSLNLAKDVNLGNLSIDFDNREVRIPKSRVNDASSPVKDNKLKLDDMNEQTYNLKCALTGNTSIDAACKQQLEDDSDHNTVFFRVLKAVQDGQDIDGLGVWESSKAFNDCGAIDLSAEDAVGAGESDGITFPYADKIKIGGDFTPSDELCPLRNPQGDDNNWQNIRKYYALGGVEKSADGYTLHTDNEEYNQNGCKIVHKTIVHFSGKSADKLNGQFYSSTKKFEYSPGACGDYQTVDNHFIIELTKVN